MSREFREIVCMNCFDVFTVNTETNHPWKCTKCREPIEATIGQWHDFIAMNANEVVFDPTPEESDRILRESAVEFGCDSSPEEVDLDNDLIADLKQQLDTALADLENEREAGDAMMKQLDEAEKSKDYWYESAVNGWNLAEAQQKKHIRQQIEDAQELNLVRKTLAGLEADLEAMMKQLDETAGARDFWYRQAMAGWQSVAALDKIYNRTWRQRVRDWWTAATYAHSYGDRC